MAVFPSAVHARARVRAEPQVGRLYFLDNLRVVLTLAVIAHHAGQAYGPTGGFWPIQEAERAAVLGPFFAVNRSFGLSLFFMIAGYFAVRSYDAHGPRAFVRSRLSRLGLPLFVFTLFVTPLLMLAGAPSGSIFGLPELNVMHMWFVEHLLIYSLCYAGLRTLLARRRGSRQPSERLAAVPSARVIVLFTLGLALVSAIMQIWYDTDEWVNLLGFIRVAFTDLPRDLSCFVAGALAYRHQWLERFPSRAGRAWLGLGLLLAALWYVYDLWGSGMIVLSEEAYGLSYAVWESLLCYSMCIGLLVVFRDRLNAQTPLTAQMGRSQYLAYIIHVGFVLALQAAALALPAPPFVKFVLVTLVAAPLTFVVSSLLRRPLRI